MFCPVCDGISLREVEKNGVLIDVCPSCKGVWLDRGELDKLMKDVHAAHEEYDQLQSYVSDPRRKPYPSAPVHNPMPHSQHSYNPAYRKDYYDPHKSHKHYGYDKYGRPIKKKKKSVFNVLEDLFD
ncbi:hypothetical protein J40TS1_24190 [Paenibacillus montaniterrae]|uniref:Transcription factor zinc-finger domain-containing protein n=1 Tax=Paenibacillus montaniterrae TaxID=429341 RepID=A0A920CU97_9BACL|nr:zf-TFIIB domain-containing protein [Paenibacillus montaniterrae]GIP16777.1 hypothetical protein J40TS1_24190 [Paenibacillus montaniterrae]